MPSVKSIILLVITNVVCGSIYTMFSDVSHTLLPAAQSEYPWHSFASSDAQNGGGSHVDLRDDVIGLDFDYQLAPNTDYPYATVGATFRDDAAVNTTTEKAQQLLDWSHYTALTLNVKCRPNNTLSFLIYLFEDGITNPHDVSTFRTVMAFFKCTQDWQRVRLNLARFDTPEWWLSHNKLDISEQDYDLAAVTGFAVANSAQSPLNTPSSVSISHIALERKNTLVIALCLVLGVGSWIIFLLHVCWPHIKYRRAVPSDTPQTPPIPLDIDSKHEREKNAIFDFLAAEYANTDIGVEMIVSALGINRTKINDILKDETGLTLTAYINKLRLTEATRLLSEKNMSVSETAYAVGYGNVSYFNRVFKKEFGCTPSEYKTKTT